ncbi:MAG: lipopolysaccharide heptosyltransferase family protein [Cyanobacteria bacterium M_surface_10_m2_119]|nr:lipopolysaccharide heptosyltransferase family protein [Cyanobacteria bacterium M_surface_10_m2_119]
MRALFLIPGESSRQLQAFPAVAAVAGQLKAEVQVACPAGSAGVWALHPGVSRTIPFAFEGAALADWANLLGSVREPDFQLCINRASGRQVDLMLSMSHIPTRIAAAGFSATERVGATRGEGWLNQADWEAYLQPIGVTLNADAFRLPLAKADLEAARAELPSGDGPLLLLAPQGGSSDWPTARWQELPGLIRQRLAGLRTLSGGAGTGTPRQQAARLASADVVLSSDPVSTELALLLGLPLVALGRDPASLPARQGVQGLGPANQLPALEPAAVLQALGFS